MPYVKRKKSILAYIIYMYGTRIRELREEESLSQKKLGKALGVSQTAIAKYENEEREPNINMIIAICKYFDVTSDYLLGLEDETGAKTK